jgi:hypothetical protein
MSTKQINIIAELLEEFPDFAKSVDTEEGTFYILGRFGSYLRDGITNDTIQVDELNHAFDFLNQMAVSDDPRVQNQLIVGVLEILTDDPKVAEIAKKKLKNKALEFFENINI